MTELFASAGDLVRGTMAKVVLGVASLICAVIVLALAIGASNESHDE